jgi:DNA polymerase-3 subunit gamma/tau
MLSKNAFNALLKTLEEPPPHIKFIFATTEVKKIPITIISRCQRFDLHRIEADNLIAHLNNIADKERININKEAIALIIRAADGSVRDGLSLFDQAIANAKDQITTDTIISMLGLADRDNIFDLLNAIFSGDAKTSLKIYNKIYRAGADVLMIFDELLKVTHFLTKIKISPDIKDDIHIPELERSKGAKMAEKISMSSLGIVWQVLFKGYQELQSGFHLFQHGEMLIVRLIYLYEGPSPDDLVKKISDNIEEKKHKNESIKIKSPNNETPATINKVIEIEDNDQADNVAKLSNSVLVKSFRQFVDLFYQKKEGMLHTYLYNKVKLVSFKEGEIVINSESIVDPHFCRTIAKYISKWTGRIWQVSTSSSNIGKTLYEEDLLAQQKEIEIMKNDPQIKQILNKYPGVKIHSITDIRETLDETIANKDIQQSIKEK